MLYKTITRRGLMASAFLAVFAVTLLFTCVTANADPAAKATGTAAQNDAAYKAAIDTDPHLPLTVEQKQALKGKEQRLAGFYSAATGRTLTAEGAAALGATAAVTSIPAAWGVAANQQPQQRSYWCGPATLCEALGQCGVPNVTQAQAASWSGTTASGTAWSGGPTSTGHPMADVMNSHQSRNYFVPQALSYSPTASEIGTYKARLVNNIYNVWAPLIGDAFQTAGSTYHLTGHPTDRTIFHWFDIFGYTASGGYTRYEDSVSGSPVIGWSGSVPPYSWQPSNQVATICGGRGYIW
jgi:hypothetical protein